MPPNWSSYTSLLECLDELRILYSWNNQWMDRMGAHHLVSLRLACGAKEEMGEFQALPSMANFELNKWKVEIRKKINSILRSKQPPQCSIWKTQRKSWSASGGILGQQKWDPDWSLPSGVNNDLTERIPVRYCMIPVKKHHRSAIPVRYHHHWNNEYILNAA